MHNSDSDKVFAVLFLGFAFLNLFLTLFLGAFSLILLDIRTELGNPEPQLASDNRVVQVHDLLFLCYDLPLNSLLVVWPSTCRAQTIHIILDVVEAKLTDLWIA